MQRCAVFCRSILATSTTLCLADTNVPMQFRERAQRGREQSVIASFRVQIGTRRLQVNMHAEARSPLALLFKRDVGRVDFP